MSTFLLVPGAGGSAWYWSRVVPLLESAGQVAVAVDLPADDESAGLREYAAIVTAAAQGEDDVVLVASSLGGFTAPLVCEHRSVSRLVLVNAMVPLPGETPGEWWEATGWSAAREEAARAGGYPVEFDVESGFLHDVPPDVAAEGADHQRPEAEAVFASPCDFTSWPDVPIQVVAGADDRFFPVGFQARVTRERLGLDLTTLPGGHLVALSNPAGLTALLLG